MKSVFVVVPSVCYENCPLSILESFALGKPVIASQIGGIPELVEDHKTGLLFKAGDAKNFAEKIEWLIKRPEEIARMGQKAQDVIKEKFNSEKHYDKLMKIYLEKS